MLTLEQTDMFSWHSFARLQSVSKAIGFRN